MNHFNKSLDAAKNLFNVLYPYGNDLLQVFVPVFRPDSPSNLFAGMNGYVIGSHSGKKYGLHPIDIPSPVRHLMEGKETLSTDLLGT